MIPQTQPTEVVLDHEYAVAHQHGLYNGPSGGFLFQGGLPLSPVTGQLVESIPGWQLRRNGLMLITRFWALRKGHVLRWTGADGWVYEPAKRAPRAAAPSAPKAPLVTTDSPSDGGRRRKERRR